MVRKFLRWPAWHGWAIPLLLAIGWELLSRQGAAWSYAFVPLESIAAAVRELLANGELALSLGATLKTAATGLLIGSLLGLAVGTLMGISGFIEKTVGPLYHTVRQVPLLGWLPLIGLWFGNGDLSKVLIVSLATFYPMVLNTYEGIRHVDKQHLEVGRVLRFSRWRLFRSLQLPGAMPSILTGAMHALAYAWISTVGSELLFASGPGIGGLMQNAQAASRMDIVVVCVFAIGVTGLFINSGFLKIRHRLLRWRSVH